MVPSSVPQAEAQHATGQAAACCTVIWPHLEVCVKQQGLPVQQERSSHIDEKLQHGAVFCPTGGGPACNRAGSCMLYRDLAAPGSLHEAAGTASAAGTQQPHRRETPAWCCLLPSRCPTGGSPVRKAPPAAADNSPICRASLLTALLRAPHDAELWEGCHTAHKQRCTITPADRCPTGVPQAEAQCERHLSQQQTINPSAQPALSHILLQALVNACGMPSSVFTSYIGVQEVRLQQDWACPELRQACRDLAPPSSSSPEGKLQELQAFCLQVLCKGHVNAADQLLDGEHRALDARLRVCVMVLRISS